MRSPPRLVQLLFAGAAVLFVYSMSSTVAPAPSRAPRRLSTAAFEPPAASLTSSTGAEDGLQPRTAAAGADAAFWLPAPLAGGARTAAQQISACKSRRGPAQQRKLNIISPCQSDDTACKIVSRAAARSLLIIGVAATPDREKRKELLSAARDVVGTGQLLAVVTDTASTELAQSLGLAWWRLGMLGHAVVGTSGRAMGQSTSLTAMTWHAAARLIRAGATVVVSSGRVHWHASPFEHLAADVDVEAAQAGERSSRGAVVGVHDPPMGWSAYGQTMTCPLLSSHVVALMPTTAAAELSSQLASMIDARLAPPAVGVSVSSAPPAVGVSVSSR